MPDVADGSVDHRQTEPGWAVTHDVRVEPGSRLAAALGAEALRVNSFHHQAVERLGDGLRAVAWSPDGTIEGIEGDEAACSASSGTPRRWTRSSAPQARLFGAARRRLPRDRGGALV